MVTAGGIAAPASGAVCLLGRPGRLAPASAGLRRRPVAIYGTAFVAAADVGSDVRPLCRRRPRRPIPLDAARRQYHAAEHIRRPRARDGRLVRLPAHPLVEFVRVVRGKLPLVLRLYGLVRKRLQLDGRIGRVGHVARRAASSRVVVGVGVVHVQLGAAGASIDDGAVQLEGVDERAEEAPV